jgi:spermidine/putrescine ABC transporter ATP-binding subunit
MQSTAHLRIERVTKRFGAHVAVDGVDLDIAAGEFITLLGPSGCGKTTLLRMIAGFESPDAGRILLDGEDIAPLPPHRRPVNTVFQHYALFPHLSVAENVAYGLRRAGLADTEVKERVREALAGVRLDSFADRAPTQLSGGQKQRVALARALVLRPRVLLLDEPLGALDHQLRLEMQVELKHIQRAAGITFLFVTHDQPEALTMSDRIAVLSSGRIEQLGTAWEVYERPATEFVARFMGASNLLPGRVAEVGPGRVRIALQEGPTKWFPSPPRALGEGDVVKVMLRPEWLQMGQEAPEGQGWQVWPVEVAERIYQGSVTRWTVKGLGPEEIEVTGVAADRASGERGAPGEVLAPGRKGVVAWRDGAGVVLPGPA